MNHLPFIIRDDGRIFNFITEWEEEVEEEEKKEWNYNDVKNGFEEYFFVEKFLVHNQEDRGIPYLPDMAYLIREVKKYIATNHLS
jgi:hypothetical protein